MGEAFLVALADHFAVLACDHRGIGDETRVRALALGCTYCGGPGSSLTATGPVRVLQAMSGGNVETAMRASYAALINGLIPGARLHTFDRVGHQFGWEQPLAVAQALREHCLVTSA